MNTPTRLACIGIGFSGYLAFTGDPFYGLVAFIALVYALVGFCQAYDRVTGGAS